MRIFTSFVTSLLSICTKTNTETDDYIKKHHLHSYLEFIEQQLYCPRTVVEARHCYHGYAAMPWNKDACLTANRRQFQLCDFTYDLNSFLKFMLTKLKQIERHLITNARDDCKNESL